MGKVHIFTISSRILSIFGEIIAYLWGGKLCITLFKNISLVQKSYFDNKSQILQVFGEIIAYLYKGIAYLKISAARKIYILTVFDSDFQ